MQGGEQKTKKNLPLLLIMKEPEVEYRVLAQEAGKGGLIKVDCAVTSFLRPSRRIKGPDYPR